MSERGHKSQQPTRGGHGGGPMGPGGPMRGQMPGEKAKNFGGTMKRLIKYFGAAKVAIIFVLIVTVLSTVFTTISPKVSVNATDSIQSTIMQRMAYEKIEEAFGGTMPPGITGKQVLASLPAEQVEALPDNYIQAIEEMNFDEKASMDFPYIGMILLICLGLYAFSAVFQFLQGYIMAGVTQRTVYQMRNQVSEKLNRLPMKYFDTFTHGEILSRVTNDIDNISNTMQQSLTQILSSVVTIISILIMMLTISLTLTLITLATLPVIIIITIIIAKHSQKQFMANQTELGNLNGHVEEMYTGHKIVTAYGKEDVSLEEFEKINERLYAAGWKSQFVSGIIMPLSNFINNLGFMLICVVGGNLAVNAKLTVGSILAFTQYSRQFTQPIVQTANIVNILQSTAASAERVFNVLDETEEIGDGEDALTLDDTRGTVDFENVSFGYNEDKILITDMNIHVEPGQMVAIVGPTGAGKTTLVNLLMRFYELNGGQILIDGKNITEIERSNLRSQFGMVLQDTWLFNGTIRDNISYGRDDALEDDIVKAAKASYVDRFVRTLSEGYDTVINEEASNLSQGQKQLITIARAILADPSILILDEATSSVDTRTELLIQKAMNKLMSGRTSFVIAHRLSTIRGADLILVMNHGDIIEQGTHDELMAKNGFYADLYNSQFAGQSAS